MSDATGIILAGGKGSRIKRNKALIELPGGRTLIRRCVDTLHKVCGEILIVSNEEEPYQSLDARVVEDIIKAKGPLGGIYTGLFHSKTHCNFIMACDMPFPQPDLIRLLLHECDHHDVVVPEINGEVEPLFAVYSKNCLQVMSTHIQRDALKIRDIFEELRTKKVGEKEVEKVDPKHLSFFNINTQEDLIKAWELGECGSGVE
jgi:molybdopterin-guanine dinucleotide biosynthesis protein A